MGDGRTASPREVRGHAGSHHCGDPGLHEGAGKGARTAEGTTLGSGTRGRGGRGPYLADHVLYQASAEAVVPRVAVAVGGVVPLVRRGRQGRRVAPFRAAAVAEGSRRPPGGGGEGSGRGAGPVGQVAAAPPGRGRDPRRLGALAVPAAPEVGLVQEEGVRELAEADEERRDPGEQHKGLLVAAAQAPEEGQHRPVVVQQQEARVRAAGGVRGGQRLDVAAAARARASPERRRGGRVPGRQGAVLLGRGRQPPRDAARRLAPPVYRHGPGSRRAQRRIERSGGSRGAPGRARGPGAAAAAAEEGPPLAGTLGCRARHCAPMAGHPRPGCGPGGRRAEGGQRPRPSAAAAHRLRGPGAGGRARRSPRLRARRASRRRSGAAPVPVPVSAGGSPAEHGTGGSALPARPGCIYPTPAPPGSRELDASLPRRPRSPARLRGLPPPPASRPAPSPPARWR